MEINAEQIRQWYNTMKQGQLVEIRILSDKWPNGDDGPTYSGIFDNPEAIINALQAFGIPAGLPTFKGCYYGINALPDECREWPQYGRILRGVRTVGDKLIIHRDWLVIDFDPEREAGVCSTDEEKQRANGVAESLMDELCTSGLLPYPAIIADSGNGYHYFFKIDEPNTPEVRDTIKAFLNVMREHYKGTAVDIDCSMFNASRIIRLPGTMNCKGEDTPERPHRMAYAEETGNTSTVQMSQLEAIVERFRPKVSNESTSTSKPQNEPLNGDLSAILKDVEYCVTQFEERGITFQADRDKWHSILCGWYHSLGEAGLETFARFSALWDHNDPAADRAKYLEISNYPREDGATIESFFALCRQYGIERPFDYKALALDYSQPCPPPPTLLTVCGVGAGYEEGITTIAGKKKAAKSTTVCAICASFLGRREVINFRIDESVQRLALFDTEQPTFRVHRQIVRSFSLAGRTMQNRDDFVVLPLRPYSPTERRKNVLATIRAFRPDIAIIDGVTDLLKNTNDPEESEAVVSELLALTTECHCSILAVIHTNTNDPTGKQRGHIGSCLERKQEACIFLEKNENTGTFRVEAKDTRDKPFPPFHFMRNDEGDPVIVSVADKPAAATDKLLDLMVQDHEYTHAELVAMLVEAGAKDDNAAKAIQRMTKKGYIIKSQQGTYRLPYAGQDYEGQEDTNSHI